MIGADDALACRIPARFYCLAKLRAAQNNEIAVGMVKGQTLSHAVSVVVLKRISTASLWLLVPLARAHIYRPGQDSTMKLS